MKNKIEMTIKPHLSKVNKVKLQKGFVAKLPKNYPELERVPSEDHFDFSTEELGFFTRRDSKGNILEVIQTIFPR